MERRIDPSVPSVFVGEYQRAVAAHVQPPVEVAHADISPALAFFANESLRKREEAKEPSVAPLPTPWRS